MAADRVDVEPRTRAPGRADLPPGATVADLVAALAARGCSPRPRDEPGSTGAGGTPPARAPGGGGPERDRGVLAPRCLPGQRTDRVDPRPRPPARRPAQTPKHAAAPAPHATAVPQPRTAPAVGPTPAATFRPRVANGFPASARPPIGDDLSLFGLSRRTRGRLGTRVFGLCFAMVFGLIFVQMIYSILYP